MRTRIVTVLLLAGLTIFCAGSALASGFSIYEAGSKATALGCAFTATADDGSALFYNAAGLSFQQGKNLDLNFIGVAPQFKFNGRLSKNGPLETGEAASKVYLVPGVAYTRNDGGRWSYGVGVYAPFGLGVEWKDGLNWVGRRISHDVAIQTVYVTPAVSYLVAEDLSFAVGVDVARQHLSLKRIMPYPLDGTNAVETHIEGSSSLNFTPSFGLMYRPTEKLSFGAMYHFEKTFEFEERDATLTNLQPAGATWAPALIDALGGPDQLITSELNVPSIMALGLAYQASPKVRLEGNYVRFGWSTFEKLELDFTNPSFPDQVIHFDYEDSWQVRFGLTLQASDAVDLMAGYVHDKSPQPLAAVSPLLPDSDRNDYSFGVLLRHGDWQFNVSYMVVIGDERINVEDGEPVRNTTDYPFGAYKSLANLFGVGMRHSF